MTRRLRPAAIAAVVVVAVLAGWSGGAMSAAQPTNDSVESRLERVAGIKASDARAFLAELQRTIGVTDRLAVCALVSYPLRHRDGDVRDPLACQRRFAEIFTSAVVETIRSQEFAALFVNAQGAMLGDGQVWFAAVCVDRGCALSELRITAINDVSKPGETAGRPR